MGFVGICFVRLGRRGLEVSFGLVGVNVGNLLLERVLWE
jgi:hypothetical protein